jgi:hypothetical protein
MNIKELYWAAGFIEGEGHFRMTSLRSSPAILVTQVQREPLERLKKLYGGQIHVKDSRKYNPSASSAYEWSIGGGKAAGLIFTLFKLMSPKRKKQIGKALAYWRNSLPKSEARTHCSKGHALDGDNLRMRKRGAWMCRVCVKCEKIHWDKYNERSRMLNIGPYGYRASTDAAV